MKEKERQQSSKYSNESKKVALRDNDHIVHTVEYKVPNFVRYMCCVRYCYNLEVLFERNYVIRVLDLRNNNQSYDTYSENPK